MLNLPSNYLNYNPPAGDVTAPILTLATGTETGQTTGSGTVTTDEGNGTLYWVTTQSSTIPSVAQIKASQDHTGASADASGNQSVNSSGVQNITITGLTASTDYYNHYVHTDAASNDSNTISSTSFTTDAAGFSNKILVDITGTAGTRTFDSQTIQAVGRGVDQVNLVKSDGVASSLDITWQNVGNTSFGSSGVNSSGAEFDTSAWLNYVWTNNNTGQITIEGFSAGQSLQLQISGSRSLPDRGTEITVIGGSTVTKSFDAGNNTSYTSVDDPAAAGAVHIDMTADGSGNVVINWTDDPGVANVFGYLGNLKIFYN